LSRVTDRLSWSSVFQRNYSHSKCNECFFKSWILLLQPYLTLP